MKIHEIPFLLFSVTFQRQGYLTNGVVFTDEGIDGSDGLVVGAAPDHEVHKNNHMIFGKFKKIEVSLVWKKTD